jgi:hypothetical protein
MRVYARLRRFRLGWLVGPWVAASVLGQMPRFTRLPATEERLVRLYAQATGVDPNVARAEVEGVGGQRVPSISVPPKPVQAATALGAGGVAAGLVWYAARRRHRSPER